MFVTVAWRCSRQRAFRKHRYGGSYNPEQKRESHVYSISSPVCERPRVPCFAVFASILPDPQGCSVRTAALPIPEDVRRAVSQFPITDCSFCNVDQECHACGENTDYGSGYPSLTGIPCREKAITDSSPRMYSTESKGALDLRHVSFALIGVSMNVPDREANQL